MVLVLRNMQSTVVETLTTKEGKMIHNPMLAFFNTCFLWCDFLEIFEPRRNQLLSAISSVGDCPPRTTCNPLPPEGCSTPPTVVHARPRCPRASA